METPFVNRVAESQLKTIDLEEFFPKEEMVSFDLKDFLFQGLILKEKDYREALKNFAWENFRNKNVAVFCSTDAIIPVWAFMLAAVNLEPVAAKVFFGTKEEMTSSLYKEILSAKINPEEFRGERVIVKGCSDKPVPVSAYVDITNLLKPVVKSLMYGEPCSNVPLYKEKKIN